MDLIKKYPYRFGLLLVFFIGAFLRFYHLGSLPFEPHEDEILVGYVGRYILENGKDIYGNKWPILYFNKFNDYYIIGPMYLSGLATYIFGVTEFAVRFPAAFFGSLVVLPVFMITRFITNNKLISLLAAFTIAIMPWHIILSRSSVEGIIGSTLFLAAIVLLLYYVKKGELVFLITASGLIFLSYGIYHPFRLYAPLIFLPLFFLFKEVRAKRKKMISIGIVMLLFFLVTFYISSTPWGKGRFLQTSIFGELSGVGIRTQEQIYNTGTNNIITARLFHNKIIGYGREFTKQYLSYFSPIFLFIQNGAESRYDVPDQGLLFLTFLLSIIAIFLPFGKRVSFDKPYLFYFLYLLLIAPIPAAFTYYGSPNIHRAVFLAVLLSVPIAMGMYRIITSQYRKVSVVIFFMILAAEFAYFWHQYSIQSDVYLGLRRNDGQREVMRYIQQHSVEFDEIVLPAEGSMALYYLFYTKDFNVKYSRQFKTDVHIAKIANIVFMQQSCPTEYYRPDSMKSTLIVNRHSCNQTENFTKVTELRGKNPLLKYSLYTSGVTQEKL